MAPEETPAIGTSYPGAAMPVVKMLSPDGDECWVNEQDQHKYLADGFSMPGDKPAPKRKGRGTEE